MTSGIFFLATQIGAGILMYGFQIWGAARVSNVAFGEFNLWLMRLNLALSVGIALQIFANLRPTPLSQLKRICAGLSLALLFALHFFPTDLTVLGGIALIASLAVAFLSGQLQARLKFFALALVALIAPLGRLALLKLSPEHPFLLPQAVVVGSALTLAVICGLIFVLPTQTPTPKTSESQGLKDAIWGAVILSFAMTLLPQLDLLNLQGRLSPEEIGIYSQASLPAKGLGFGFLALIAWTLPYHLRPESPGSARVFAVERLALVLGAVGACVAAMGFPWLSAQYLRSDLSEYRAWILLGCLNILALYHLLRWVQMQIARGALAAPAKGLAVLLALCLLLRWIPDLSATQYLLSAFVGYSLLSLGIVVKTRAQPPLQNSKSL